MVNDMSRGFHVKSSSECFKLIKSCLDEGRATTKEVIIMEKEGVNYEVRFDFHFRYDWSNGLQSDPIRLTITKDNGEEATSSEETIIRHYIDTHYRCQ